MTAGGGRRPPGGPPRDLHSLGLRPDGEWPGQVVSLGDIWHTEALIDALAADHTIPPGAPTDPAVTLLAALLRDLDPSVPTASTTGPAAEPGPLAQAPQHQHSPRPWPLPIRVLVTAVAVVAAVALVALVQPPWPSATTRTAAGPLAAPLPPAAQIRAAGPGPTAPGSAPLAGTPSWVPPSAATTHPAQTAPSIPADARSGPASAARPSQPAHTTPATPDGLPASTAPGYHPATSVGESSSGPGGPATVRRSVLRRLPRKHAGPGTPPGPTHSGPGAPAPAGHRPGGTFHRGGPVSGPGPQGGSPAGQKRSPVAHPWQFWMRSLARAHPGPTWPAR